MAETKKKSQTKWAYTSGSFRGWKPFVYKWLAINWMIKTTFGWWQLKYFFNFHPEIWGRWTHFDLTFLQMGWWKTTNQLAINWRINHIIIWQKYVEITTFPSIFNNLLGLAGYENKTRKKKTEHFPIPCHAYIIFASIPSKINSSCR